MSKTFNFALKDKIFNKILHKFSLNFDFNFEFTAAFLLSTNFKTIKSSSERHKHIQFKNLFKDLRATTRIIRELNILMMTYIIFIKTLTFSIGFF